MCYGSISPPPWCYTVDTDMDEHNVQDNIYWFLHGFFDKHPELEGRALYITGESYAGHYVPAAAHKIWTENKAVHAVHATIRINSQEIAIGNGLTNSMTKHNNAYNITLMSASDLQQATKVNVRRCLAQLEHIQPILNTTGDSLLAELTAHLGDSQDVL
jgi:carboxypeptidase C (cathepsin A)